MQIDSDGRAYLELRFAPNVELVSIVRRFVGHFYEKVLGDPDVTARLAVATHELLENTVKFSVDGHTRIRIEVAPTGDKREILIETLNRASTDHITRLRSAVDEIEKANDPLAHYQVLIRRTAKMTSGSGLGLGRIRAEAEMAIKLRIDDDRVTVNAQTFVEAAP